MFYTIMIIILNSTIQVYFVYMPHAFICNYMQSTFKWMGNATAGPEKIARNSNNSYTFIQFILALCNVFSDT